jgi:hypothetical protein
VTEHEVHAVRRPGSKGCETQARAKHEVCSGQFRYIRTHGTETARALWQREVRARAGKVTSELPVQRGVFEC